MRLKQIYKTFCLILAAGCMQYVRAFDDVRRINPSYHMQENFLDLKEYQFHKLQEEEWYASDNGWRSSGGSIGLDLLYNYLEIKFHKEITPGASVGLHFLQDEFFFIKPFRYLIDVEWRPFNMLGLSFVGMPEYDKRYADQGGALTLGRRPWNYLRLQQISQDLFYNEKNFYDDSYYDPHPVEDILEAAVLLGPWRSRIRLQKDYPLKQVFPTEGLTFTHLGNEARGVLDYHFRDRALVGVTWQSFNFHKSRETPLSSVKEDNRAQQMIYHSADFYWLQPYNESLHATIGVREDRIRNLFRQHQSDEESYDYHLWTLQLYGILIHKLSANPGWEYGFYIGDTEQATDYIASSVEDLRTRRVESALRVSWVLSHLNDEADLVFSTTWNIDEFTTDLDEFFRVIWDGGQISYQHTF